MHSIALSIQCGHSLIVAAAMFAFALAPGLAFVAPSVAVGWSRRSLSHCRRSGLSSTPRGTTSLSCSRSGSPIRGKTQTKRRVQNLARKEAAVEARNEERVRKLHADVREIQKEMKKKGFK